MLGRPKWCATLVPLLPLSFSVAEAASPAAVDVEIAAAIAAARGEG